MARPLADYRSTRYDELVDEQGRPRPAARALAATVEVLGTPGLLSRQDQTARAVADDAVTYDTHREWRLDPLPLILDQATWADLTAGLVQRAELLDAVLADLYGPRNLLRRGVLPAEVVLAHPEFMRAADGVRLPSSRQLFLSATDLVRCADGTWLAVSDRTQAPSGAGYALQNRRVISRVMPGLYRAQPPERLRGFGQTVRTALLEVSPLTDRMPRVAILSPGPESETAFDQAFLSTVLGYPLVTSDDLTVRGGRLFTRGLGGLEPVDVLLRRVDSQWADPLEGLSHSVLGVPGLLEAARQGHVSVVNPLGSGVLENPGLLAFLEPLATSLLGEDLRLPGPVTYWCGQDSARRHVLANLDRLVVKPVARGETATAFGRELDAAARQELRARIEADPAAWAAQEEVTPATAPVVTPGGLVPRGAVLRTFAVAAGGRYELMQGGLARVAPDEAASRISNAAGAVTKDVWILPNPAGAAAVQLGAEPDVEVVGAARRRAQPVLSPRTAESLFWLGRYGARAEDTARLLRVAADLAEDHSQRRGTSGHAAARVVLQAVTRITTMWPGFTADPAPEPAAELLRVAAAGTVPGTVAHAVERTLGLARTVREILPADTWVVLGGVERQVADLERLQDAPEEALGPLQIRLTRLLEGMLAFAGLQAECLVRDDGWYFLETGRRLERALHLLAVLRHTVTVRHRPGVESYVQEATLQATESVITHRRRFTGRLGTDASVAGLLDLVLLDEDNPRSVAFQLTSLLRSAERLPAARPGAPELQTSVITALARLREIPAERPGLADALDRLLDDLAAAALQVERVHFAVPGPARELENQQAMGRGR